MVTEKVLLPNACSPVDYAALLQEVKHNNPDLWAQGNNKRLLGKAFQLSGGKADPVRLQREVMAALRRK